MNEKEVIEKCKFYAEAVLRRDVMETNCFDFAELSDKMCENIVKLTSNYLEKFL